MKQRTTRKIRLIILLAIVIIGTIITLILIKNYPIFSQVLQLLILLFIYFVSLKVTYIEYIILTRNKYKLNKEINTEEIEIVKDAIELIKSVDESIDIAKFNVYNVKHTGDGWFNYDEDTYELNIYIPFDRYIKRDKNICFMIVLHEILHSQNRRSNEDIFTTGFKEGINQFFTLWLIENYSKKYEIPKYIPIVYFKVGNRKIQLNKKQEVYKTEVKQAKAVIQNSGKKVKEIFLNYVSLKPRYFKDFVPKKYFIK